MIEGIRLPDKVYYYHNNKSLEFVGVAGVSTCSKMDKAIIAKKSTPLAPKAIAAAADDVSNHLVPRDATVVLLPRKLDPRDLIRKYPFPNIYRNGGNEDKVCNYMSLIIGTILDRCILSYDDIDIFKPQFISSSFFRSITQEYRKYLKYLIKYGFIEEYEYSTGNFPKSYCFTKNAIDSHFIHFYITDKKIVSRASDSSNNVDAKFYPIINQHVQSASFDLDAAADLFQSWKFPISSGKYISSHCKLEKIRTSTNNRKFSVDKTVGRLHTPFTNLKSEFRQFLTLDGSRLINVDIKNSQPFFLACLLDARTWDNFALEEKILLYSPTIREKGMDYLNNTKKGLLKKGDITEKYSLNYILETTSGLLYDNISTSLNCVDRKSAKGLVFNYLFSPLWFHHPIVDYFNFHFPHIEIFRTELNVGFWKSKRQNRLPSEQSNTLALLLQKIESTFILDHVAPVIDKELGIPYLTIHDSFMVPEGYEKAVESIITKVSLECFGISPKIKIE